MDVASEFRYRDPILNKEDLVIIISSLARPADTLAAMRLAKETRRPHPGGGQRVGSSIAREADSVLYTWAGPEIAVASTKAYTVQLSVMYLLAFKLGLCKGTLSQADAVALIDELAGIPVQLQSILGHAEEYKAIAEKYCHAEDMFFIGRGLDYALSQEGSLKLKEISYIHSEAYAAGELKHGTISLIVEGTPVVALATQDSVYEKTISNVKEVKTRGGRVILLCKQDAKVPADAADHVVRLPEFEGVFMPLLLIVPLQLFAYYMSVLRGCDVDKPRNLAKSVTVECTLPRPGPSFPAVPGVCFSPGRMLFCRLPRTADYTAPCTPILKRNGRTLPEEGRYAASPVRAHGRASARRSGSGRRHRLTTFFTNCL